MGCSRPPEAPLCQGPAEAWGLSRAPVRRQGPRALGIQGWVCPRRSGQRGPSRDAGGERWAARGLGCSPGQPGHAELRWTIVRDTPVPRPRPPPRWRDGPFWNILGPAACVWESGHRGLGWGQTTLPLMASNGNMPRGPIGKFGEESSRIADCLLRLEPECLLGFWHLLQGTGCSLCLRSAVPVSPCLGRGAEGSPAVPSSTERTHRG